MTTLPDQLTNEAVNEIPLATPAELEHLAQTLAVTAAPWLAFAVHMRDRQMIADLLGGLDRQTLLALVVVVADQVPRPRTRPDDGVVDEVAVRRVADGEDLPLTTPERLEVVRLMVRRGATISQITGRLQMAAGTVKRALARSGRNDQLGGRGPVGQAEATRNRQVLMAELREFDQYRRAR